MYTVSTIHVLAAPLEIICIPLRECQASHVIPLSPFRTFWGSIVGCFEHLDSECMPLRHGGLQRSHSATIRPIEVRLRRDQLSDHRLVAAMRSHNQSRQNRLASCAP